MTYSPRAQKAMKRRRDNPFQQFGQSGDVSTLNGALGCTHTVLQFLAYLWLGRWYSQDQVSRIAGYPMTRDANPTNRGLRPSEVQRFCTAAGLPYVLRFGWSAYEVLQRTAKGPVAFGHSYSRWPEWAGFRYGNVTADGQPNGYARPSGKAGRTQLTGFVPPNDAHFGLVLGWDPRAGTRASRVAAWEPNHNSTIRPEDPPYDLMTSAQFRKVYDSYTTVLRRTPYALVPLRSLPL